MKEDALITIHSLNGTEEDEDSIDFVTDGKYSYEGGVASLSYLESDVTGMEGTRTSVTVSPDEVVVDREGTITSRMVFRKGQRHAFQYDTPMGMATLHMATRGIRHAFNEGGGEMEIDYVLDVEHTVVSRNLFRLQVRRQPEYKGYPYYKKTNMGDTAHG